MSPVPHRAMTGILTLVVPAGLVATTFATAAAWADELPDPVAVHFGSDGPDGYASLAGLLWPPTVVTILVAAGCWVLAFFWGRAAPVRRTATGTAVGMAGLLAALTVGLMDQQRGLADAADIGGLGLVTGIALGVGIVGAALGAALMPGDAPLPADGQVPADAPRLALGPDEYATWVTHTPSRATLVVGGAATVLVLVIAALSELWALAIAAIAILVLVLAMGRFTVVVDRRGLTVRSTLGWPRMHVPLDEVVEAQVVSVSPFHEFGGWGYRVGRGGRVGVVLRTGEALQVERSGGRAFVVTVDDAATAAALLNTLAARARVA